MIQPTFPPNWAEFAVTITEPDSDGDLVVRETDGAARIIPIVRDGRVTDEALRVIAENEPLEVVSYKGPRLWVTDDGA